MATQFETAAIDTVMRAIANPTYTLVVAEIEPNEAMLTLTRGFHDRPQDAVTIAKQLLEDARERYDEIAADTTVSNETATDAENRALACQNALDYLAMAEPTGDGS
jgi:hypothetical protein